MVGIHMQINFLEIIYSVTHFSDGSLRVKVVGLEELKVNVNFVVVVVVVIGKAEIVGDRNFPIKWLFLVGSFHPLVGWCRISNPGISALPMLPYFISQLVRHALTEIWRSLVTRLRNEIGPIIEQFWKIGTRMWTPFNRFVICEHNTSLIGLGFILLKRPVSVLSEQGEGFHNFQIIFLLTSFMWEWALAKWCLSGTSTNQPEVNIIYWNGTLKGWCRAGYTLVRGLCWMTSVSG